MLCRFALNYLLHNSQKRNFLVRLALNAALHQAKSDPELQLKLIEDAVITPESILVESLKSKPWRPNQPELRSLFLLFSSQVDELFAFHAGVAEPLYHLRRAYQASDPHLRARIRETITRLRDERLLDTFKPLTRDGFSREHDAPESVALELAFASRNYPRVLQLLHQARVGDVYRYLYRLIEAGYPTEQAGLFYRSASELVQTIRRHYRLGSDAFEAIGREYLAAFFKLQDAKMEPGPQDWTAYFDGLALMVKQQAGSPISESALTALDSSSHWLDRCVALLLTAQNPHLWSESRLVKGLTDHCYWVAGCALTNLACLPARGCPELLDKLNRAEALYTVHRDSVELLNFALLVLRHYTTEIEALETDSPSTADIELEWEDTNDSA